MDIHERQKLRHSLDTDGRGLGRKHEGMVEEKGEEEIDEGNKEEEKRKEKETKKNMAK